MNYRNFLHDKFRTGSRFLLREWNQLSLSEQQTLSALYDAEDVYGLLVPAAASAERTVKVAYREVALLFLHLQSHRHLPHYFAGSITRQGYQTIAQLVLDEILEMETEGRYLTGGKALPLLYQDRLPEERFPSNHLDSLSLQAIRFAFLLRNRAVKELAAELYCYHTLPWDAAAREAFQAKHPVQAFLFSAAGDAVEAALAEKWLAHAASPASNWFSWTKKKAQKLSTSWIHDTYKLYISPDIMDLPAAFGQAIPVLTESKAYSFKVGSTVHGLLRPDKMVAYFESFDALLEAATALKVVLYPFRVQGVPFTGQLDEAGMLSWGVDPPQKDVFDRVERGSWRTNLCDHLALAVVQAQQQYHHWLDAQPFIQARLQAAGINMANWTRMEENATNPIPHEHFVS